VQWKEWVWRTADAFLGKHFLTLEPHEGLVLCCVCSPTLSLNIEDSPKDLCTKSECRGPPEKGILSAGLIQLSIYEPSTALSSRFPSGHSYQFLFLSLCPWA
jgi:hypothetical protein